jgi:hypothetical protein
VAVSDPQRKILVLALISVVAVTWRELKAGDIPPAPSNYVGTSIVYGIATVISEASGQLGLYLAFAWTLFIAYSLVGDKVTRRAKAIPTGQGSKTVNQPKAPKVRGPGQPRRGRPQASPRVARPRVRRTVSSRQARKG